MKDVCDIKFKSDGLPFVDVKGLSKKKALETLQLLELKLK